MDDYCFFPVSSNNDTCLASVFMNNSKLNLNKLFVEILLQFLMLMLERWFEI